MTVSCDCAERSRDGFVFTCPVCVAPIVVRLMELLTIKLESVRLDKEGSVSASVEVEESHG